MRTVPKRALVIWETKVISCEVTPRAIWPTANSLSKFGEQMAASVNHGQFSPIFCPLDRGNINADCLENRSRACDMCDCENRPNVEAQVEALLATVDEDIPIYFRPSDI
jgi:hypothetical protein